jgi:hypothetical protein
MAKTVDVKIRIVDMPEFQAFVGAAGDVVRAYEGIRAGGAGTALGVAIDGLRDAMRDLVTDNET